MSIPKSRHVLVTGFPAFAARKLVSVLLAAEPTTHVHCVVELAAMPSATEIQRALPPDQGSRLTFLEGNASAMDMGLSGAEYRDLAGRIERIFHFEQLTRSQARKSQLDRANVEATREAVELARSCAALKNLLVLSTTAVAGNHRGVFREDDLDVRQSFRTLVEASKARAEHVARRAMDEVPVAIVRPSVIVGDSTDGEIDHLDGAYALILLIMSSSNDRPVALPFGESAKLNLVPIDFVVRATQAISLQEGIRGTTFHLVDPSPLPAKRVYELVARAAGRRLPYVPSCVTRALLRSPGLDRIAKNPRGFIHLLASEVDFDTRNASAALRNAGIVCPPFESYVERLVDHVRQRMRDHRRQQVLSREEPDDPLA